MFFLLGDVAVWPGAEQRESGRGKMASFAELITGLRGEDRVKGVTVKTKESWGAVSISSPVEGLKQQSNNLSVLALGLSFLCGRSRGHCSPSEAKKTNSPTPTPTPP